MTVTDTLPAGLELVSVSDEEDCIYEEETNTVTWTIADVPAHTEGTVAVTVRATKDALEAGELQNTASVQVGEDEAVDTNTTGNPAEERTPGKDCQYRKRHGGSSR